MAFEGSQALTLRSAKDWDLWIQAIESKATILDVWPYIDPGKQDVLIEPLYPALPTDAILATESGRIKLQYNLNVYNRNAKIYHTQRKAMQEMDALIEQTAGIFRPAILDKKGAREKLKTLKSRAAPSDLIRQRDAIDKLDKLSRTAKTTNINEWTMQWINALLDCQRLKCTEVTSNAAAARIFLRAIASIDDYFYRREMDNLDAKLADDKDDTDVSQLAERFRISQGHRIIQDNRTALAVSFQGTEPDGKKVQFKDQKKQGNKACKVHGDQSPHATKDCYFLYPEKRPNGWKVRSPSAARFILKTRDIHNDQGLISQAEEILASSKSKENLSEHMTFTVHASLSTMQHDPQFPLINHWILDSGSDTHVTHNLAAFTEFTPGRIGTIQTGTHSAPVEGIGQVRLPVTGPDGRMTHITLTEVLYVPGFITNIVSDYRLGQAGYTHSRITGFVTRDRDRKQFFKTTTKHRKYIVSFDPFKMASQDAPMALAATTNIPTTTEAPPTTTEAPLTTTESKPTTMASALVASSSAPRPPRDGDAYTWHLRAGHPSQRALEKLLTQAYGIRIKGQLTTECQHCILAKASRTISRRPANRQSAMPMWRVHMDLFELPMSLTNKIRAIVFNDEYTGMKWVSLLRDKKQETVVEAITNFEAMANRQWNLEVKIFRSDNESALGSQYQAFTQEKGILVESSTPAAAWQDGTAERAGGVISATARTLLIAANFPAELWDEAWQAAVYLNNRTPREHNGWKTPIETLNNWLRTNGRDMAVAELQDRPDLTNLYAYGCRAYPLKTVVLRDDERVKHKVEPRAHIGYLCGYEGSNIYRIWVPQKAQVIRSSNVSFKETEFFNASDEPTLDTMAAEFIVQNDIQLALPARQGYATDSTSESDEDEPWPLIELGTPIHSPGPSSPVLQPTHSTDLEPLPQTAPTKRTRKVWPARDPTQVRTRAQTRHAITPEPQGNPSTAQSPYLTPQSQSPDSVALETQTPSTGQSSWETSPGRPDSLADGPSAFAVAFNDGRQHRLHRDRMPPLPNRWKDLERHPYGSQFIEAAQREWDQVLKMGTVQMVPRTEASTRPLPLRWVFNYKYDNHGFLIKFKARICVRGDMQQQTGRDTYAATLASTSFRVLIAIAAKWDLEIKQYDAVNAFTNSPLDELVHVELPDGFKTPGMVGHLLKALYGLRISPKLWQQQLTEALVKLGLQPVPEDPCIFVNDWLVIFVYVDDICIMYRPENSTRATAFSEAITSLFEMRALGDLKWFLGIRVIRDRPTRQIWLTQQSYIEGIANRFGLNRPGLKGPSTPYPWEPPAPFDGDASTAEIHRFQCRIGSALYAAIITRPDVQRATSQLSQFLTNPGPSHIEAVNREIQYLYSTRDLALRFNGASHDSDIRIYSDASFADNKDRKSSQGYVITLFGTPVAWQANKQSTVTTSTTEAELLALTNAARAALATQRLLNGSGLRIDNKLTIWCDNLQTIRLVTSELPRLHTALRHVDIHQCWIREKVQEGILNIQYIKTSEMPADGMTKTLTKAKFLAFRNHLSLAPVPSSDEPNQ